MPNQQKLYRSYEMKALQLVAFIFAIVLIQTTAQARTVTLTNYGVMNVKLTVSSLRQPLEKKFMSETGFVVRGGSEIVTVNSDRPGDLPFRVEVSMKLSGGSAIVIYRGIIPSVSANIPLTNFCLATSGDTVQPKVEPCGGTQASEDTHVKFKNEAGFTAQATLNYTTVNQATASISTDVTSFGMNRVFYLPADADKNKPTTLKVKAFATNKNDLLDTVVDLNTAFSTCYRVWGTFAAAKVSQCAFAGSARKIKLNNNSGYIARMKVTYYNKDQSGQDVAATVQTNQIQLGESDTIEIPPSASNKPLAIVFAWLSIQGRWSEFFPLTAPANFTGELCYKVGGTITDPTAATCADEVNALPGTETRQIIFRNEAGYNAQAVVQYFEYQNIQGAKVLLPKTVVTGFINLGQSRIITIPRDTPPNLPIIVALQGKSTYKDDIWSTTLPWDFKSSPVQCFKVWDTIFTPKGGTCN